MSEKNPTPETVTPTESVDAAAAAPAAQATTSETVRRVLALFSERRGSLVAAALLAIAVVVGTLALPVLSGQAVDCVIGVGQVDLVGLWRALAWIAITLGVTAICQWSLTAVTNRLAFDATLELRRRAFDHLQELPLSYIDSHGHGDLAARIVTDADMLTNGLLMAFQQLPVGVLTIVVTLVFMFVLNPAIAAVVALLTPISIFTARFIATHSARHFSGQTRLRGELTAYVEEMVGGISAIETFDMADEVHARFAKTDAALGEESFKAVFFSSLVNPTTRFANALVYAAIGIFGAFVAMGGGITVGGLSAFLGYADQYAKPFNDISGVATELQNSVFSTWPPRSRTPRRPSCSPSQTARWTWTTWPLATRRTVWSSPTWTSTLRPASALRSLARRAVARPPSSTSSCASTT